eukprot:CAMPEP_0206490128 /NCGR_PEP_ID=MMETSP0324_2-20121206/43798_1 /ASSEMBLY_ACC=CAM_ASM_000836 /TAXON_ID=2866 /ORGANISM="Crypthecodinium cohnii, Strain Seligo" /LENGTH=589 /DNA_ID=CAMNT_0053970233 /DNA_START=4 /DNA_END=1773 /DNA_ORIENTATION=-
MATVAKDQTVVERPRMGRIFVACRGKKGASSPTRAVALPLTDKSPSKPSIPARAIADKEENSTNDCSSGTSTPSLATAKTPPTITKPTPNSGTATLGLASLATATTVTVAATATTVTAASIAPVPIGASSTDVTLPESARSSDLSTVASGSGSTNFPTLLSGHGRSRDLGGKNSEASNVKKGLPLPGPKKKGSDEDSDAFLQLGEADGLMVTPAIENKPKKSKAGKNCSTRNCCQADAVLALASSWFTVRPQAPTCAEAAPAPTSSNGSSSDEPVSPNEPALVEEAEEEADEAPVTTEGMPPPMVTVVEPDETLGLYSMGKDVPLYTMLEEDFSEDVEALVKLVQPGERLAYLSDFAKEYASPAFALRILRKNGRGPRAAQKFEQALVWRQQEEELITHRQFPLGGDERVMGLDLGGRPVIYMCMKNQLLCGNKCLKQKVVTMLQAVECMPPGVEKTVHIWDLHGQQFFAADLSPAPLIKMMHSQDTYFAERLHEIIIIGMPRAAAALKDLVWPLVPERTKGKLRFLKNEQEAQAYIDSICDSDLAARLKAAMRDNRDKELSMEQRKATWERYTPDGTLVPLAAGAAMR